MTAREQFDLFGAASTRLRMPAPRTRATDPQTSHQAAERHRDALGAQAKLVLEAIRRWPGHTATELAQRIADERHEDAVKWRYRVSRRTADLARAYFVRRGKPRACTLSGSAQTTWYAA